MTQEVSGILTFLLVVFVVSVIISLAIFLPTFLTFWFRTRYRNFVKSNSKALSELETLNNKYLFYIIPNFDMSHSYDNEDFYGEISCEDYLIYELVYKQKDISKALKACFANAKLLSEYTKEIKTINSFGSYNANTNELKKERLDRYEKKMFKEIIKHPQTELRITVTLKRTNINGDYKERKSKTFSSAQITSLISKVNEKRGSFYTNEDIWHAICRVERGKVSNKMRFSIYARDGYRCCKCGRKTDDLEVDHIYPIAKGGKSTYDNLQTLCRRCNKKKGANIEY